MSGHVHAQYGFLVPWISYNVLDLSSSLGPTNFVRMEWIIFAACGLAYIAIFIYLFRDYPQLAIAALLAKLFFYSKVGAFMLVLAPGYHWFRELVLISVPTILLVGASHYSPIGNKRNLPMIMVVSVLLAICYFIDPIFFLIAILCALLALLWSNWLHIYNYIKHHRIKFLMIFFALLMVLVIILMMQSSNLLYVIDKLQSGNLGSTKYVKRIALTCLAAIIFLFSLKNNRHKFLASYFAFVTLASSLYYFLTPDSFHFYVFSEYAIPFALLLVLSISERFKIQFRSRLHLSPTLITLTKTLLFFILVTITVMNFLPHTPYPEFSLRNSNGEPYFHSKDYTINNRLIKANISENLAEHLRSFPASLSPDFILSPYDKYLTFLYDRVNGFGTPDLIASLDSEEKLKDALQHISNQKHPITVLVDDAVINVDTRDGIKRNNPALGKQYELSILNLKSQMRASELADALLANCTTTKNVALPEGWHILRCMN